MLNAKAYQQSKVHALACTLRNAALAKRNYPHKITGALSSQLFSNKAAFLSALTDVPRAWRCLGLLWLPIAKSAHEAQDWRPARVAAELLLLLIAQRLPQYLLEYLFVKRFEEKLLMRLKKKIHNAPPKPIAAGRKAFERM